MKKLQFINLAVFIIFFGLALIEALKQKNWLGAALFLALGALSLWADFSSGGGSAFGGKKDSSK